MVYWSTGFPAHVAPIFASMALLILGYDFSRKFFADPI